MDEATFLALSVALTGFQIFDLRATGQLSAYCTHVTDQVEPAILSEITAAWEAARDLPEKEREFAVQAMVADVTMGIPLKRIILLWYTGSWYVSPPYGYATLSGQSYVQGLMWKAIGAHAMATAPQGCGAWALPPPVEGA